MLIPMYKWEASKMLLGMNVFFKMYKISNCLLIRKFTFIISFKCKYVNHSIILLLSLMPILLN
jgi:hypothetical protein